MHILVCDDDAAFAAQMDEYISEWFRAREIQVQSTVCTSGEQLLATPELERYQLAFLDVDLKTTDGIALGRKLRQINVYGDIPHQPICTFYGKIADLPAMLYENGFLQVGRSDVVNLQYVRSIRNYKVELRSGVELSVSRQYYTAIRSAWLEWKGQFGDE